MKTINIEKDILTVFRNIGFPMEKIEPDLILGGILYDSLALITFIIELEQVLDIEIPADSFNIGWLDKSLSEIIEIVEGLI